MKLPTDADPTNPTRNPTRTAVLGRWLRRSAVVGVLVASSLAVSACGSDEPATILDTEKVERAIEQSSLEQRGTPAQVTCPSGVPQTEGWEFHCTALAGRSSTKFIVTELDDSGNVHYEAP